MSDNAKAQSEQRKAYDKAYYEANKERKKAARRERYKANPEKEKAYDKAYKAKKKAGEA